MSTLVLTKDEIDVLGDRLSLPECIADALTDHADGEAPASRFPKKVIEERAAKLYHLMTRDMFSKVCLTIDSDLDREILAEAMEGSTFLLKLSDMVDDGEISVARFNAYRRIAESLTAKLNAASVPTQGMSF